MREAERTTRQRMADALREDAATAADLAAEFDVTPSTAIRHVRHLSRTLTNTDEQLLVRPPECRECGFDDFDDPVNLPSRCPSCKHEAIHDPAFTID